MSCRRLLTASRMKAFLSCERRHFYRYHAHKSAVEKSDALAFGTVLHKGLEVWWETRDKDRAFQAAIDEDNKLGLAKSDGGFLSAMCLGLTRRYMDYWGASDLDQYETLAVEKVFVKPMPSLWGGSSGEWENSGKIDVLVRDKNTGKTYLMDHKTSASNITPGSAYWQRLAYDPQISLYFLGAKSLGYDIDGFIYDVIRKPYCKRKLATPPEKMRYKKDGAPYAWCQPEDESLPDYTARVWGEIVEPKEPIFVRQTITRTAEALDLFISEMETVASRIDQTKHADSALRNSGACQSYGVICPYIQACGGADIDSIDGLETLEPFQELKEEGGNNEPTI